MSGYQSVPLAWILALLAIGCAVYGTLVWRRGISGEESKKVSWWSWFVLPFGKRIPLREVAIRAYQLLEKHDSSWKVVADNIGKFSNNKPRAENAISYLEIYFVFTRAIPVFGKHPPSRVEKLIPFYEIGRCVLDDGGNSLRDSSEEEPQYVELRVNWSDVKKIVKEMCKSKVRKVALDALLNQPQIVSLKTENTKERIPFIDFLKEAERCGIDFKGTSHAILELCQKLRQAASDGIIEIYGRERFQNDPFVLIPKEHWHEFEIDWVGAFKLIGEGEIKEFSKDNFFVISRNNRIPSRKAYFDLQLNHIQALKILRDWKGK